MIWMWVYGSMRLGAGVGVTWTGAKELRPGRSVISMAFLRLVDGFVDDS
jgi:hypothetical protein